MPVVIIGLILLYLLSKGTSVGQVTGALSKQQQSSAGSCANAQCCISTTCKGKGPVQHMTPQVLPPTNVPVPTGIVVYDSKGVVAVATHNATLAIFLDAYDNILFQQALQNGQSAEYNYSNCACVGACGCGWACGSGDFRVAKIGLQGPGGTLTFINPFYTIAASHQGTDGNIGACGGCKPAQTVSGYAFQDKTTCYPCAVNNLKMFAYPSILKAGSNSAIPLNRKIQSPLRVRGKIGGFCKVTAGICCAQ